jgi:hypothetical protein
MEEKKSLGWGASWLLPKEHSAAWGARAIADKNFTKEKFGTHIADLLHDRMSGIGGKEALDKLFSWVNKNILPITMDYDGSSCDVTEVNDGEFHARWTPNGSFGYIYIITWVD